jgi:hypothetical protein
MCSIFVFLKSCKVCGNVQKYGTNGVTADDNIMRRMRLASWINKATNTHSEFVILIAFPLQQWLHERASI